MKGESHGSIEMVTANMPRLLPLVTAVGYVVGYWALADFSSELGVSVRDLGLDLRDVLLLAGFPAAAWMVGALLYFSLMSAKDWAEVRTNRSEGWCQHGFIALEGIAQGGTTIIVLGVAALTGVDLFTSMFAVGLTFLVPSLLARVPLLGILAIGVVTLVVANGAITQVAVWAEELRHAAASGDDLPRGPIPARLLLTPSVGQATIGDDTDCVVRVGQRVLIGAEVVVVAEPERFSAEECTPDDRPFDP